MRTELAERVDLEELIHSVLPCEGIEFHDNDGGNPFESVCPNVAEWSRTGHCSKDKAYCTPCMENITSWARHGWVKCRECNTTVWPEMLNWIRI